MLDHGIDVCSGRIGREIADLADALGWTRAAQGIGLRCRLVPGAGQALGQQTWLTTVPVPG